MNAAVRNLARSLLAWIDTGARDGIAASPYAIDWVRQVPFVAIHAACLLVPVVGTSVTAVAIAVLLYAVRMFAITAFYHRYFSHRAFRAGRVVQFCFAVLGAAAAQRGPLWWASHHRHHHVHSDQPADAHSALRHGFAWSHMGWFMSRQNFAPRRELVATWARYPELRFLDRWDTVVPVALILSLWALGTWLQHTAPTLGTSGPQLVVWGFCVSTVALYHATFSINSFAHRFGRRRYATRDESRNNAWLALVTFGEGWHNNHHHYPAAARQGFFWWEIDLTWYGLRLLAWARVISDLKPVPIAVRDARAREEHAA